jgi:GT2 family glycosyltransferase
MAIADDVGVVVIGRNEGERLVNCLNSVKASASRVVYVDSGSADESVEFAARIGAYTVRLDPSLPFTAARARNEGFLALKSLYPDIRFVQFIDGDCILVSGWLEAARAFLTERTDVAVACGRRRELHPDGSIYNRLCDMEWNTSVGEAEASGGDALVRAEAFEAAGRYRATLIAGEEPELCLRLRIKGWKIWRLDAEMTLHDAAMTRFGQWWARAVRCGYGYADVTWLYRNSPQGIWRRETLRALIWGGSVPAAIGIGALGHPAALLGVLVYPLQVCRMALKDGAHGRFAWERASLVTLIKFAEFQGVLRFLWHKARRRAATLIEYK